MNEEEKKAVGLLKALNNLEKKCKIEKVPYKSEIKKIRISLLPEDYGIFEILLNLIEKLQKENEGLKEYKKIAELTKISCCTAQNCEALNNAIKSELENQKLKEELNDINQKWIQKVKDKIEEYKNMLKPCNKVKDIDRIKAINERILELEELLEGRK